MAIEKPVTLANGITVNYHRVVLINNIINRETLIEVCSYINYEARQKELQYLDVDDDPERYLDIYTVSSFISTEYKQDLTIEAAYDYLKTLPEYEGAIDV